jgi:hypothetical protein
MRFLEGRSQLGVRDIGETPPGRHTRSPERLGLPEVADSGNQPLVEHRVADLASLVVSAQAPEHRLEVGRLGEDVRAESLRDAAVELEDGTVEHRTDVLLAPQHEPRLPEDRRVPAEDTPTSLHAQVAANHEAAFEVEQQVLPDCLDALQSATVEPRRELLYGCAWMRRLDLELLPDQYLQSTCGAVKGVPFGHAAKRMSHRLRAAAAGAVAAVVWGLQEPLDQRVFGCDYSDVEFLGRGSRPMGLAVHAVNGALFGVAFDAIRRRVDLDQRRLALGLALAEHAALWPFIVFVDRGLVTSPRAFAQATYRHALFGVLLGRLSGPAGTPESSA